MKKSIVLMLSGLMVFGLAACKEKSADGGAASSASSSCSNSLVKDYEKFVDEYIAAAKKAKTGDMSAVQELQALSQKAQDWATKYQAQAGSLTEADAKEFNRIAEKFAKAMQE
ncbi:MAG: hypothetical protein LBD30_08495 [Verrucomicrobiales bacterium]|jgi:hypothetical protein|nr:hypothetical protein [Verrucomicrobiales bacterium]